MCFLKNWAHVLKDFAFCCSLVIGKTSHEYLSAFSFLYVLLFFEASRDETVVLMYARDSAIEIQPSLSSLVFLMRASIYLINCTKQYAKLINFMFLICDIINHNEFQVLISSRPPAGPHSPNRTCTSFLYQTLC
jgi:hypothetical protein